MTCDEIEKAVGVERPIAEGCEVLPENAAGTQRVRVRFAVNATDAVDGSVAVACTPKSGSSFRIGRTTVRCSAIDSSANSESARFTITVAKTEKNR